jgi:hypothetical protein
MAIEVTPEMEQEVLADPRAFWERQAKEGITKIDALFKQGVNAVANTSAFYMKHLRDVLEVNVKELAILRELEARIKLNTLSEDGLADIMSRLDSFRAELEKENERRVAAINAATQEKK